MTSLVFKYNDLVVLDTLDMGGRGLLESSQEYEIEIGHDSDLPITECGFYISPFTGDYKGSHSPRKDLERILWYGDNYPGFGLSLIQRHSVTGVLDSHNGIAVSDYERFEQSDIFAGQELQILSGNSVGESVEIDYYDTGSQTFILKGDFSNNVGNENYRIIIRKEQFFKSRQGSAEPHSMPLIKNAGRLERLETADVFLRIRTPKFALSAGDHLFDFNMRFTSIQE